MHIAAYAVRMKSCEDDDNKSLTSGAQRRRGRRRRKGRHTWPRQRSASVSATRTNSTSYLVSDEFIFLHCALSCAVYCNRPCLCVCLWVRLTTASAQCLHRLWALFSLLFYYCCYLHSYKKYKHWKTINTTRQTITKCRKRTKCK